MAFLSKVARAYQEGFSVYGDDLGVEWPTAEGGAVAGAPDAPGADGRGGAVRQRSTRSTRRTAPISSRRSSTRSCAAITAARTRISSHEFVRSIVEGRAAADRRADGGRLDGARDLRPRLGPPGRSRSGPFPPTAEPRRHPLSE